MLQTTLFDNTEDKAALKRLIQTSGDAHLEEVVARRSLPMLRGVLKKASTE